MRDVRELVIPRDPNRRIVFETKAIHRGADSICSSPGRVAHADVLGFNRIGQGEDPEQYSADNRVKLGRFCQMKY